MASWRPPRPASTTATSTPWRASSSNAAAVISSNCVTRSPGSSAAVDLRRRRRGALDGGAELVGLEVAVADPDALGERGEVRREERARADAVRLQQRRGHAHRRALAVRADDVDRAEALLRRAQRGEQPAHALQAEAHAEQLEAEQMLLRPRRAPASQPVALLPEGGELRALGLDHRRRAPWPRSPGWPASSPRARSRRPATRGARRSGAGAAPRSTASDGSTATEPPGTVTVATGSAPSAPARSSAREPRHVLRGALVALGLQPRGQDAPTARRRSGRASRAAPGSRGDRAAELRLGGRRRSARHRPRASGGPSAGPRRRGRAPRAPR